MTSRAHVDSSEMHQAIVSPQSHACREATRYLCAAAYTDSTFRREVLRRRRETLRAQSPEVGVETRLITEHCEKASRLKAARNLFICVPATVLAIVILPQVDAGMEFVDVRIVASCWLAAAILIALHDVRIGQVMRKYLIRKGFYETENPDAAEIGDGNVIVYSGFSPFIGAGVDIGGWSFSVDVTRSKRQPNAGDIRPFGLKELYDRIAQAFEELRFPALRLDRKLFVNGQHVRAEKEVLRSIYQRPIDRLPADTVAAYADGASRRVRHYLCVESLDWDGDMAVTLFVRFQKLPSKLFIELSSFLLPPLKAEYYDLDRIHSRWRLKDLVGVCGKSIAKAPFLLILAPLETLGSISDALSRIGEGRRQRKRIDDDLLFDYGAGSSVRELATGKEWRAYFQKLDVQMHCKVLQQQLLDSLVDFLDEHGIDTSELKERTTHILNNGVIVSGGSINAQGLTVGQGAQTTVNNAARRPHKEAQP